MAPTFFTRTHVIQTHPVWKTAPLYVLCCALALTWRAMRTPDPRCHGEKASSVPSQPSASCFPEEPAQWTLPPESSPWSHTAQLWPSQGILSSTGEAPAWAGWATRESSPVFSIWQRTWNKDTVEHEENSERNRCFFLCIKQSAKHFHLKNTYKVVNKTLNTLCKWIVCGICDIQLNNFSVSGCITVPNQEINWKTKKTDKNTRWSC